MEVVKVDEQGRLVIPKALRERRGLTGEVEVLETDEGVVLRPKRGKAWDSLLNEKLRVEWGKALAVSLEKMSVDDLLFG